MKRLWKYVKLAVTGAVLIVAAKSMAGETHDQSSPLFCLPRLFGGGGASVCVEPDQGYELIGGFGG